MSDITSARDEAQVTLEKLIDSFEVPEVLAILADVCFEKAEHIRSNWQDEPLARAWETDGRYIEAVGNQLMK